jgi:hypothetical protein
VQALGGRIVYHDHYVDNEINRYYTRLQWDLANFTIADGEISDHLTTLAGGRDAHWSLSFSDRPWRMAVFVSKEPWCLYDILARTYSGEWPVEIPVIVANHPDLKSVADRFGIAFHLMSMTADNKAAIEEAQLALLADHRIDLVVLAKYMQIVSARFVRAYGEHERHDFAQLLKLARQEATGAAWKRLGFLAERLWPGEPKLADTARRHLSSGLARLDPRIAHRGKLSKRWRLWINVRPAELATSPDAA